MKAVAKGTKTSCSVKRIGKKGAEQESKATSLHPVNFFGQYEEHVFNFEKEREQAFFGRANIDKIEKVQPAGINSWRCQCINHIFAMHRFFKTVPDTPLVAIALLNRLLTMKRLSNIKYIRHLSATCFYIALKYEEPFLQYKATPKVSDISRVCKVNAESIIENEPRILTMLGWKVDYPTVQYFVYRYCSLLQMSDDLSDKAQYFADLSLHCNDFVYELPSLVAAVCVYCARSTSNVIDHWPTKIAVYSKYTNKALAHLVEKMMSLLCSLENDENGNPSQHQQHIHHVRRKWWDSYGSQVWN